MDENLIKRITQLVIERLQDKNEYLIPMGVSARHIHLCQKDLETLFGLNHTLTKKKELMGGQYACEETVTIVGTKLRAIENIRILGPIRSNSQVEISRTDAIKLGINAPLRESGDIKGSHSISIVGPKGVVYLDEGCIIAKRHIHMSEKDAEKFHVSDGDLVQVKINSNRGGIFSDVKIRVDKSFTLEMHIDTDEANAFGINCGEMGMII